MHKHKITLSGDQIETAYFLTGIEKAFDHSHTQCSRDSRALGVIGEIAATEYLRGMYGVKRTVIPMGIVARSGGGHHAYGMGDIITIDSSQSQDVRAFEVKSRTAGTGKGNIIRCDSAEEYVKQGITRVIFVDVDIKEDRAECSIAGYVLPEDILSWDVVTNGMGQECYIMPTI